MRTIIFIVSQVPVTWIFLVNQIKHQHQFRCCLLLVGTLCTLYKYTIAWTSNRLNISCEIRNGTFQTRGNNVIIIMIADCNNIYFCIALKLNEEVGIGIAAAAVILLLVLGIIIALIIGIIRRSRNSKSLSVSENSGTKTQASQEVN